MNTTLTEVELDLKAVFRDPKAEAEKWLREYNERKQEMPEVQQGNEADQVHLQPHAKDSVVV